MNENIFSINGEQYKQMTDEMLIENIKKDDKTALNCLIERYNDVVNMKANKFYMVGAEREDMVQEGMIGLYKAIKSFDTQKQNSFKTFANMCIERQLITAVKNSNRQKHIPLNSSISLNSAAYDDNDDMDKLEIVDLKSEDDPLDIITNQEYSKTIETKIKENLSKYELSVLYESTTRICSQTSFSDEIHRSICFSSFLVRINAVIVLFLCILIFFINSLSNKSFVELI